MSEMIPVMFGPKEINEFAAKLAIQTRLIGGGVVAMLSVDRAEKIMEILRNKYSDIRVNVLVHQNTPEYTAVYLDINQENN